MQSAVVWRLNHDTTISFGFHLTQFPKFGPHPLHRYNSVRVHPYAHNTAYEDANTLFIHSIWIRDAVSSGLQPQPWHHTVIWAMPYPNFPKFGPHPLHSYNSVIVHPYAHPQHMKVLKHFMFIQYGCGMQSVVVYSLNHDHDTTTSFGLRLTPILQDLAPTCTGITV